MYGRVDWTQGVRCYEAIITPELANKILELNTDNRPIRDYHVRRLAALIVGGRWKFNGRTIIITKGKKTIDGQHRLWAVIESGMSIRVLIVEGIEDHCVNTIDTVQITRTPGDTVGTGPDKVLRHRNQIASALTWLLRWQQGVENYKQPENRVENDHLDAAKKEHPQMQRAVERAMGLRKLVSPGILASLYYVVSNRNPQLAERMMETLESPAGASARDPFFQLRTYYLAGKAHGKPRDALQTIAATLKAINAAHAGKQLGALSWRGQGKGAEDFPKLKV